MAGDFMGALGVANTPRAERDDLVGHAAPERIGAVEHPQVFALAAHALNDFAEVSLLRAQRSLAPLVVPRRGR